MNWPILSIGAAAGLVGSVAYAVEVTLSDGWSGVSAVALAVATACFGYLLRQVVRFLRAYARPVEQRLPVLGRMLGARTADWLERRVRGGDSANGDEPAD